MIEKKPENYEKLIMQFSTGMRQRQLYFTKHPSVKASIQNITNLLRSLLKSHDKDSYFLGIVDSKLVHEGHYLIGPSITGKHIIDLAEKLNCGGLLFKRGVTGIEIEEFFNLSVELASPVHDLKEARTLFKSRNIFHIELSPVYEDPGWFGQFLFKGTENWGSQEMTGDEVGAVLPVYQSMFDIVDTAHTSTARGHSFDINKGNDISEQLLVSTEGNFMDIMQLVRYPDYDSYTVGHSIRVALIAVIVAHKMGMDTDYLIELGTAGLFHDVGKAIIPNEILYKKGKLSPDEMRIVKIHPGEGARILLEHKDASRMAISGAWGHHIRNDGKGYPEAPGRAEENFTTSLLQLCDVFEALTAARPYKKAKIPGEAFEIMLQDHKAFHHGLLAYFIRAMTLYPPGSKVLLSNGKEATVINTGNELDKPKIKLNDTNKNSSGDMIDLEHCTTGLFISDIITY